MDTEVSFSRVVVGKKNSPTVAHTGRKRRPKWVPSAWGYNWAALSLGVINTETRSSRLGLGVGLTTPPHEKDIVKKPESMPAGRTQFRRPSKLKDLHWGLETGKKWHWVGSGGEA
jgi:hypothetical protein